MNVKIKPSKLIGRVNAPSSKSFSHRMLIAAALAGGVSEISNISSSEDIDATVGALTALGAKIFREGTVYTVMGIKTPSASAVIDCRESG
ncbi:MAG: 3-phosphoshikimate 1-carboxyvinyltransferase, partial [Oscillospiraceae bacterium]|nr:3-phosphoshikimate 1-carboxyvinyltransferase [Oscillospiraceae bacterium]